MKIDLNCDLGEGYGRWEMGLDELVLPLITSANVACGWHAGDPSLMRKTVRLALENKVRIGAHPGYPDRLGFGRRNMQVPPEELRDYIVYQTGALAAFVRAEGGKLQHVKPHGAMYNEAAVDMSIAEAVVQGVQDVDDHLILLCPSNSALALAAQKAGLRWKAEVFADRAYLKSGQLAPRSMDGAVFTDVDHAISQALLLATGKEITTLDGSALQLQADSICVHGDNGRALDMIRQLRQVLNTEGIALTSLEAL